MRLRIYNSKNGRLNAAACGFLFGATIAEGGRRAARFVVFQRDDPTGKLCVADAAGDGLPVNPRGNVTVSSLTAAITQPTYPITIILKPETPWPNARLVFAGVAP